MVEDRESVRLASEYELIKDNIVLLNKLYRIQQDNKYNKGYVYMMYLKHGKYYCTKDLTYICKLFNYKRVWITHRFNELSKSSLWRSE